MSDFKHSETEQGDHPDLGVWWNDQEDVDNVDDEDDGGDDDKDSLAG